MTTKWKYSPEEIFAAGPVVPVLVINDVEKAVPLAKALMEGGIKVLEVTSTNHLRAICMKGIG